MDSVKYRQWTDAEYRSARRSHVWNMVMSFPNLAFLRGHLRPYELRLLASVASVLTDDERAALADQLTRIDGISRHFKGRYHTIFIDRRRLAPLGVSDDLETLATLEVRQGGRLFTVFVETTDGALASICFRPGRFREKEPFEIVGVTRGGPPCRTPWAIDRQEHGRDPDDLE